MNDHRKNPRVGSLNLVSFTSYNDEGVVQSHSYSRTLNLSREGMLLEVKEAPALNTLIIVSLGLGEKIIQVQGKIVRVEERESQLFTIGISFLNVNPYDQKVLDDYLKNKQEA